jgi:hypothetical protein
MNTTVNIDPETVATSFRLERLANAVCAGAARDRERYHPGSSLGSSGTETHRCLATSTASGLSPTELPAPHFCISAPDRPEARSRSSGPTGATDRVRADRHRDARSPWLTGTRRPRPIGTTPLACAVCLSAGMRPRQRAGRIGQASVRRRATRGVIEGQVTSCA